MKTGPKPRPTEEIEAENMELIRQRNILDVDNHNEAVNVEYRKKKKKIDTKLAYNRNTLWRRKYLDTNK